MNLTTPKRITSDIIKFCSEIDYTTSPVFVPVDQVDTVKHDYCLTDVPLFAEKNGGDVQFGWIIWEWPKAALEAEFHACWISGKDTLVDIVPKPDNEKTILFLPNSQRVYEHKPVSGCQKALIDNDYTRRWLMTARKKDEIRVKHIKNDEVDAVAADAEFKIWI